MTTDRYEWAMREIENLGDTNRRMARDMDLCFEENRILTESLDRSKDAIAAVIEQREELARRIRESKR